ncbi:MAG: ribulose-phosphate 3-epimerase [Candidatus Krumholzibacteriia bacterium]
MNWWRPRAEGAAVAPSLLAADFADLAGELLTLEAAEADLFHLDVMDGHFVPNLTLGPALVAAVRRRTALPLDVHLMVTDPLAFVAPFADAGADALTVHVEATAPREALRAIGARGLRRGVSLNPATPVEAVAPLLGEVDLALVMSVQPGFGGQRFQPAALGKVAALAAARERQGLRFAISIDGGVEGSNAAACRAAGADILVSGSWLLGAADRAAAVRALRGA